MILQGSVATALLGAIYFLVKLFFNEKWKAGDKTKELLEDHIRKEAEMNAEMKRNLNDRLDRMVSSLNESSQRIIAIQVKTNEELYDLRKNMTIKIDQTDLKKITHDIGNLKQAISLVHQSVKAMYEKREQEAKENKDNLVILKKG
jgi:LPS O-antigen subunit length determinant protein (WzzB/FepE family)